MAGYVPSTEEDAIAVALANPNAAKALPVRDAPTISIQGFGPVLRQGSWTFNRGIRIVTPANGAERDLFAMATGSLVFVQAIGTEPPSLGLVLTGLDDFALRSSGMPAWVPPLTALVYRGVDSTRVAAAVQQLLADPARLANVNKGYQRITGGAPGTAASLAQVFIQNPSQLADGIPVTAGELIGAGSPVGTERVCEILAAEPNVSAVLDRNPAWYFAFWVNAGLLNLGGHSLGTHFIRTDQGIEANGTLRFVAKTGNDAGNAPYTDAAQPALTVRAAIGAAVDGDTILILDDGTYREPEIVVDKAINLTSAVSLGANQAHLGGAVSDAAAPVVPATMPILQGNGAFQNIADNMVGDTAFIPTAATHRVLQYNVPAGRGIASLTKVVVRYGGAREGGGIFLFESGPVAIASCHIHRNVAYFNALFFNPVNGFPHPYRGSGWSQEGFGGGICAYTSSPIIWGNRIDRNLALNGGGIGLFARCFPLIANNYIAKNVLPDWFGTDTPGDGGGIRVLSLNLRTQSIALSNLDPSDPNDFGTLLSAFSNLYGASIDVGEMYDPAQITECQSHLIHLRFNRVLSNRAGDDGGGVYATGVSRMMSVNNSIYDNTAARGDGGGFRISTASLLRSIRDTVVNNRVQGAVSESATGGGVAIRCSDLHMLGGLVEGNSSHFAGAGISFTVNREGAVTGTDWLPMHVPTWDEQRAGAFHYTHAYLQIDATTRVLTNRADDATSGKGGGIYIFRMQSGAFVGDSLSVEIEDAATVLDVSNDSGFVTGGNKPFKRLYLLDQTANGSGGSPPLIWGDVELAALPGTLSYNSI